MRSLFLKILLTSFATVTVAGLSMTLAVMTMMMPATGELRRALPLVAATAVALSGLLCYMLSRHITAPLLDLRQHAHTVAAGHLAVRVSDTLRQRRDEIGSLGRDLDRMAERLESLVDGHKQTLRDISHELRSPLARVAVALGLAKKAPPQEFPELLARIALEAHRLDLLIGQLLTLSRLEGGIDRVVFSPIDLTALLHDVAADGDFEGRPQLRRVQLVASARCTVSGSEELLRSALENVVRNAIRHTPPDTTVAVSIHRDDDQAKSGCRSSPADRRSQLTKAGLVGADGSVIQAALEAANVPPGPAREMSVSPLG